MCHEASEESLIDLESLKDMGIIHKDFPLPNDKNKRKSHDKTRLVNSKTKRIPTKEVRPTFPTHPHLQNAVDKELDKLLKAGVLEPVDHLTDWFFVQKDTHTHGQEAKAHLVSDLRGVNKVLKEIDHPPDGSSHILKRLNQEDKLYAVCDLCMGYHQLVLQKTSLH